jgi:dihydroneopterin aldolase
VGDVIEIRGLRALAVIGVRDDERHGKQEVRVDLRLHVDAARPGASDRLEDAVDYDAVAQRVILCVERSSFHLLERLASEIARIVLQEFGVPRVEVRVEKPAALPSAESVSVTVDRSSKEI